MVHDGTRLLARPGLHPLIDGVTRVGEKVIRIPNHGSPPRFFQTISQKTHLHQNMYSISIMTSFRMIITYHDPLNHNFFQIYFFHRYEEDIASRDALNDGFRRERDKVRWYFMIHWIPIRSNGNEWGKTSNFIPIAFTWERIKIHWRKEFLSLKIVFTPRVKLVTLEIDILDISDNVEAVEWRRREFPARVLRVERREGSTLGGWIKWG